MVGDLSRQGFSVGRKGGNVIWLTFFCQDVVAAHGIEEKRGADDFFHCLRFRQIFLLDFQRMAHASMTLLRWRGVATGLIGSRYGWWNGFFPPRRCSAFFCFACCVTITEIIVTQRTTPEPSKNLPSNFKCLGNFFKNGASRFQGMHHFFDILCAIKGFFPRHFESFDMTVLGIWTGRFLLYFSSLCSPPVVHESGAYTLVRDFCFTPASLCLGELFASKAQRGEDALFLDASFLSCTVKWPRHTLVNRGVDRFGSPMAITSGFKWGGFLNKLRVTMRQGITFFFGKSA